MRREHPDLSDRPEDVRDGDREERPGRRCPLATAESVDGEHRRREERRAGDDQEDVTRMPSTQRAAAPAW